MDKSFHYLLMVNQSLFQKRVYCHLAEFGITPGQPRVLDFLDKHDGSMQKELAYGCQTDPASLTGILARMEEKGLVERRMEKGNRRSSYVYLTKKGREIYEIVKHVFLELEQDVFEGISEEEKQQFIETFYKLCSNMTDTEGLQ